MVLQTRTGCKEKTEEMVDQQPTANKSNFAGAAVRLSYTIKNHDLNGYFFIMKIRHDYNSSIVSSLCECFYEFSYPEQMYTNLC